MKIKEVPEPYKAPENDAETTWADDDADEHYLVQSCRFCGGEVSIKKSWFGLGKWKIVHTCHGPQLKVSGRGFCTEDEAAKAWFEWNWLGITRYRRTVLGVIIVQCRKIRRWIVENQLWLFLGVGLIMLTGAAYYAGQHEKKVSVVCTVVGRTFTPESFGVSEKKSLIVKDSKGNVFTERSVTDAEYILPVGSKITIHTYPEYLPKN